MSPAQVTNQLFIAAWRLMTERFPGARLDENGGLVTRFANVPLPFLNISFFDQPIADLSRLERLLKQTRENGQICPHSWLHVLCEDLVPADWQSVAEKVSLTPAMKLTGMLAPRLKPPTRPLPELEWRQVRDDATARDLATINAQAYAMPVELFTCLHNTYIWKSDTYAAVGYLDGQPVTCSAALPVEGTLYLAFVATMPGHRAKGFAEASMRHTASHAQTIMGDTPLTLHSSDAGRPLYAAMGFEAVGTFTVLSHSSG